MTEFCNHEDKIKNLKKRNAELIKELDERTAIIQDLEDEARERERELEAVRDRLFVLKDADMACKATLLRLAQVERRATRFECLLLKAGIDPDSPA